MQNLLYETSPNIIGEYAKEINSKTDDNILI